MVRGPVPKRSSQRRRRNYVQVDRVVAGELVEPPPLDLESIHELAQSMYQSLAKSGQARFMEPSDWEYARWTAFVMSKAAQKPTAMMILAVDKMLSNLMVTEADRRRVRVEIDRSREDDPAPIPTSAMADLAARRARLMIS